MSSKKIYIYIFSAISYEIPICRSTVNSTCKSTLYRIFYVLKRLHTNQFDYHRRPTKKYKITKISQTELPAPSRNNTRRFPLISSFPRDKPSSIPAAKSLGRVWELRHCRAKYDLFSGKISARKRADASKAARGLLSHALSAPAM